MIEDILVNLAWSFLNDCEDVKGERTSSSSPGDDESLILSCIKSFCIVCRTVFSSTRCGDIGDDGLLFESVFDTINDDMESVSSVGHF